MKKFFFLAALLCASVMGFAVNQDTWIPVNADGTAYANQFKWYEIDGVAIPNSVVEIQKPGFATQVGIYITFADAAFNAVYYNDVLVTNETEYKQDGAGICFYVSALTAKNTRIIIKNNETVRFGLTIYNDKGAEPIESEYCGYEGEETKSGDKYITLTWETLSNGDVEITMGAGTGATSCAFRNGGFEGGIGAFVVSTDNFETTTPASNYFSAVQVYSGNTYTLTKIAEVPASAKIKHVGSGHALAWTVDGAGAYSYPDFIYTYGSVCDASVFTDIKLSASAKIAKVGDEVTLTAKAVDQNGMPMDGIDIDLAVSPADMGSIEGNVFTFAKTGVATITASSAEIETSITLYGVPSDNLALNQPCEGGYYDNNPAESFDKANDGNTNTAWVTYADQPATKEWWYVDLGDKYTLAAIDVLWGDPASNSYILQVRDEAPTDEQKADDEAWETLLTVNEAGNNSEQFNVVTGAGRYVRLRSLTKTANFLRLKEVRVFGTKWVDPGDTEAPVMVSATLESKTYNTAVIAVEATDNIGIAKYHVVDATNSIDKNIVPAEGKITITGLTPSTEYNLVITAIDASQNESANSKSVEFTTNNYITAPTAAAEAPTWPAAQAKAIYSPTYNADCNFANWGGCVGYTQEEYGKKYEIGACGFFGVEGFSLNCINMEKLHYDIWVADNATVRIVPICRKTDDSGNEPEIGVTVNLTGQQWNSIDLSLATDYAAVTNWTNVYQVKIDNAANLTIWVGNAYFYRTTELPDAEAPTNVSANATASYFSVVLNVSAEDNSGEVIYSVKLGDEEVATGGGASGATAYITVANLQPNTVYNFSVIAKDAKGNAAEPVAVVAKTLVAPAPADAPTYAADKVIAIYSDIYTDLPYNIQDWYAGPVIAERALTISSNALCIEPNTTVNSCFGMAFAATDISGYDALEMDVYATSADASFNLQVIGVGDASTLINLTAGAWNHVVLEINGNTKTNCEQIGFYNCNNLKGTCFVQNILFVKKAATAIDNTMEATKVQKMIENGQLIIIKNGIRYNVAGQLVK